MRRKALEQKAEACQLYRGNKERRRDSIGSSWIGDYIKYEDNYQMQDAMQPYMEEMCCFADDVHRLNKNGKLEKRSFLLTESAFYLVMRVVKKKVLSYSVTRRVAINSVSDIVVSSLPDGYTVIHVPGDHDVVIECEHKTELIMLMREHFKNATGRELTLRFADTIEYVAKAGEKQKHIELYRDDQAIPLIQQQEATKNKIKSFFSSSALIRIGTPGGLDRNGDYTPKGWNNTFVGASGAPAPRGPRGGNRAANAALAKLGGGMYDASAAYEEEEAPAPAPVARPAPSRGAPAGGGGRALPAAGGARGGATAAPPAPKPAANKYGAPAGRSYGAPAAPAAKSSYGGGGHDDDEVQRLRDRIAELERENADLKQQLAQARSGGGGGVSKPAVSKSPVSTASAYKKPPVAAAVPPPPPPMHSGPSGEAYRALYTFNGEQEGDLTFRKGDIIYVQKKDGSWWEGTCNGRSGPFPSNYVTQA